MHTTTYYHIRKHIFSFLHSRSRWGIVISSTPASHLLPDLNSRISEVISQLQTLWRQDGVGLFSLFRAVKLLTDQVLYADSLVIGPWSLC